MPSVLSRIPLEIIRTRVVCGVPHRKVHDTPASSISDRCQKLVDDICMHFDRYSRLSRIHIAN